MLVVLIATGLFLWQQFFRPITGQEILDRVIAAAPGVRTGKFQDEFNFSFLGMIASVTSTGIFDLPTGRFMEEKTELFFTESKYSSLLLLGDLGIYSKDGESSDWIRVSEEQIDQLATPWRALVTGQAAIYGFDDSTMVHETYQNPRLSGSETFNGVECFVVIVDLNDPGLSVESFSTLELPLKASLSIGVDEARLFVGKNDYFVYGLFIEMTVTITSEGSEIKIPIVTQENFYDFNLSVEFPEP